MFRRPRFGDDGSVSKPARITVIQNGILVQDDVEVWGPTAWLQHHPYTQHADALPLSLQDHGNPIRYRNVWLRKLPERSEPGGLAERKIGSAGVSDEQLQQLVGDYGSVLGAFGKLELDNGTLRLRMDTGQLIDLIPRSATEFEMRFTAGKLDIKTNDAGKVTGFTMHLGGSQYPIQRLESAPESQP